MNRKQKWGAKVAAVSGAVIYLMTNVPAHEGHASAEIQKAVDSPVSACEVSMTVVEPVRETASGLVPEPVDLFNPYTRMSLDWDAEQIEGFKEYQVPEKYARNGGYFPVELQQFTYVICENYGVDYELILSMIEVESAYCSDAESVCGAVGYMQVVEKWHKDRMERLNVEDLSDPYSNIMVGVDYMAELLEKYPEEIALGIYNMGYKAVDFWNDEKIITGYAKKVLARRTEIYEEVMQDV